MKPGQAHDANGRPIYPGDLLRTPHFRGRNRRQYYLYHVAVLDGERIRMMPANRLDASKDRSREGGDPLLSKELAEMLEIIQGYGPGDIIDFYDRPRKNK